MTGQKERPGLELPDLSTTHKTTGIGSGTNGTEPPTPVQASARLEQLRRYDNSCLVLIPQKAVGGKQKRPLFEWKKYQDDPPSWSQILRWHRENPQALWGYICGTTSGQFTLDFDGPEGMATLKRLGLQPSVRTPSGGAHV